ncbi:glycyl-radical enzyme activating protein [Methylomonas rosea]|uniref:Glycyl-radical enzyme activating protein n=1 Tax=Methylomonas rosea TaxID=2952227 RepID=A0ABT1TR27_9GAMM|nr:glycyl-radical enzyme activating protein [Methylomonas sp. WSC-7]MCQ8116508.1 glycyl-radical enzyme activating protein [Methylomonas sp. WSC-7]
MDSKAYIFDIKRNTSEDGPGIRTTVFFKGCPLSCSWCQNPEGIAPGPSLSFRAELCHAHDCEQPCLKACKLKALTLQDRQLRLDRELCDSCGRCATACSRHALEKVGKWLNVDELFYRVTIDKPFFDATGGGVTVSGGECTMQMNFLHEFFKKLKAAGIRTAIETNGMFNFGRFARLLLPWLDLIYFDLKLIDEAASIQHTGHSNRPILDNLLRLTESAEIPVKIRIPLIPEITATDENLRGIARFLREHRIKQVSALPYNPLWLDKLQCFGIDVEYRHSAFMSDTEIEHCIDCLQAS